MPEIESLIGYIEGRRVHERGGSGYSYVRGLPPTIRDTFFAQSCLKMLKSDSPDGEIIHFLSEYESFDFNGTYYAMKCLKLAGAEADYRDGKLCWYYDGDKQIRECAVPITPLIHYFKYDLYGMYCSSIFSSPLSAVLKRIELNADISNSLVNSTLVLLSTAARQDIMILYMALEILRAMEMRGCPVTLSSSHVDIISAFLKGCSTRNGYTGNPTSNSVTLESTYAGHRIAQYLKIPEPLDIISFINSLQNNNGGFRASQFGGISTLESCYLAISIFSEIACNSHS